MFFGEKRVLYKNHEFLEFLKISILSLGYLGFQKNKTRVKVNVHPLSPLGFLLRHILGVTVFWHMFWRKVKRKFNETSKIIESINVQHRCTRHLKIRLTGECWHDADSPFLKWVSGVGCDFCLWLFLDFSVYLWLRVWSAVHRRTAWAVLEKVMVTFWFEREPLLTCDRFWTKVHRTCKRWNDIPATALLDYYNYVFARQMTMGGREEKGVSY